MSDNDRGYQNGVGESPTADDFPAICECGRLILSVQTWSAHECPARDNELVADDGPGQASQQTEYLERVDERDLRRLDWEVARL